MVEVGTARYRGRVRIREPHYNTECGVTVGVFTQPSSRWSYKHLNISRHTRIRSYTTVAVSRRARTCVCVHTHASTRSVLNILRGTGVTGAATMRAAAGRFPETRCNVNRRRPVHRGGGGDERHRYPLVAQRGRRYRDKEKKLLPHRPQPLVDFIRGANVSSSQTIFFFFLIIPTHFMTNAFVVYGFHCDCFYNFTWHCWFRGKRHTVAEKKPNEKQTKT